MPPQPECRVELTGFEFCIQSDGTGTSLAEPGRFTRARSCETLWPVTRWVVSLAIFASLAIARASVTIDGREYVPLSEIAASEGMSAPSSTGGKVFDASGNGRSIRVKKNSRDSIVNGVRMWLAFPVIEQGGRALVSKSDYDHVLRPAFRPESVKGIAPVRTIVLDPGHGGHDRGASGLGMLEKDLTLDMTRRVRQRLEKAGFKVVQTRTGDKFIPLENRPTAANRMSNAIFVSLHFNSADWNRNANGVEVYAIPVRGTPPTGQKSPLDRDREQVAGHASEAASAVLANTVMHSLRGGMDSYDRGVKRARFSVLRNAKTPAILIESGFLTNATEARKIATSAWRDRHADCIARGIAEYAALAEKGKRPRTVTDYGGRPTTDFVPES